MKVILKESYMSLGEAGDLVTVRPGYARNFLIPQKIAVTATKANVRLFEDKVKEFQTKKESERDNSKKTLSLLEKLTLTVKKKMSDEGKLFGSITTKELEAEFTKLGARVDRRQIVLGRQIKMMGEYSILVKLVGGLKANVPLKVEPDAPLKGMLLAKELEEEVAREAAEAKRNARKKAKTKGEEGAAEETPTEEASTEE